MDSLKPWRFYAPWSQNYYKISKILNFQDKNYKRVFCTTCTRDHILHKQQSFCQFVECYKKGSTWNVEIRWFVLSLRSLLEDESRSSSLHSGAIVSDRMHQYEQQTYFSNKTFKNINNFCQFIPLKNVFNINQSSAKKNMLDFF